jgi:hypothetical protein
MTESVGAAGYNPSTPFWTQIVPTSTVLPKAMFTGLVSGSFISAFNVYAKYTKSGATALTSVPSNTISVQLAPPAPNISALTGATLTNTGFSIEWNNITVPAGSPYTLSYTFSGTYSGLTAGTRTIDTSVTTWPFTVTSLPNGGTVTNLSITATYTSGASTLSTASNTISSVTIPGLPPVITSFTLTQGSSLKISPFWPPVIYTWTLSGGTPNSYLLRIPGTGSISGSISSTDTTLTSATSPYSVTYSAPIPTWNTSSNQWNPYYFNPYMSVTNAFGNVWTNGPAYYYPPGVASVALATSSNTQKLNVYIRECPFATRYTLQQETFWSADGGGRPTFQFKPIASPTHQELLGMTDSRTTSTNWKLLGEITLGPTGRTVINVTNPTNVGRFCTITQTLITTYSTQQGGGARISLSLDNAITQSSSNGVTIDSYNLVNLSGTNSFNFTF